MKKYYEPELKVLDFDVIDVTNANPESDPFTNPNPGDNDGEFGNSIGRPLNGGLNNNGF